MNRKHAALAVAAAAVLSAPAFAESNCTVSSDNLRTTCTDTTTLGAGPVMSSSGATVSSGTGVTVTPGVGSSTVAVETGPVVAAPGSRILPGSATVQASQTTVLGGPAEPGVSGSKTVVTRYWINVPAGAEHRADFQRWQALKP